MGSLKWINFCLKTPEIINFLFNKIRFETTCLGLLLKLMLIYFYNIDCRIPVTQILECRVSEELDPTIVLYCTRLDPSSKYLLQFFDRFVVPLYSPIADHILRVPFVSNGC